MKIFNIQQLFRGGNKRTAKWVSSLLFLFCLISFSNNVVAQQVVLDPLTVIPATIACAGGTTIITANATGPASIEYYIDGVLGTNPFTVSAGSHTVKAQEVSDPANYDEETINITETLLSASVSGDPYFCTAGSGTFTVSVSGGMTDYTVKVTGQPDQTGSGPDFTFSGLTADTYPITVTDNCPTTATVTYEFIVEIDAAGPVVDAGTNDPVETDYASFVSGVSGFADVTYGPAAVDFLANGSNENAASDLYNYSSATYSFTVNQTGLATASDVLRVSVSTDNGSTYGTPIEYFGPLSGLQTGTIPLSGDPNQNRQIKLKLEANIATSGLEYHITFYQINAIAKVNSSTFGTTQPSFTDAVSGMANVELDYDGEVFWYSSVPGSEELVLNRYWEATDNCNKTTSVPQFIRVGAPPVINMTSNPNLTFGCGNRTHAITAPTATDNASAAGDIVISWALDGVTFTNGNFPSHEFTAGEPATITWRATDQAGFSSTEDQTVTINPYITIALTPLDADFCEENPASFTVTTSGGSDTYSSYNFLPTGSFVGTTFTTSGLTPLSPTITINCTDNTGCTTGDRTFSTSETTSPYTVHPKIVTNSISRSTP